MRRKGKRMLMMVLVCYMLAVISCPLVSAEYSRTDDEFENTDYGRILKVRVVSTEEGDSIPVKNVSFRIFWVAEDEEMGMFSGKYPSCEELTRFWRDENLVGAINTDENGNAMFDFRANSLPDGVYLVMEQANPAIRRGSIPFYLIIPNGSKAEISVTLENVLM